MMMPVETEGTLPEETVRIPEEQDIRIRLEEMEQILPGAVVQVSESLGSGMIPLWQEPETRVQQMRQLMKMP